MGMYSDAKEIITDLVAAVRKLDRLDLERQINELERKLFDGDRQLRTMTLKIEELEEALRFKATLVFERNAYWNKETNEGPYCSGCWDSKGKPIRLTNINPEGYRCPVCDKYIETVKKW